MTFEEKLAAETSNRDEIHLHLEGIFWKAYEKSAFLFVTHLSDFKATKKMVRAVKMDVVSVGFPSHSLEKVTEGRTVVKTDDDRHLVISGLEPCNEKEFVEWKGKIPLFAPSQEGGAAAAGSLPPSHVPAYMQAQRQQGMQAQAAAVGGGKGGAARCFPAGTAGGDPVEKKVLERLTGFRVESSTPVECMLFITQLQKELGSKN